MIPPIQVFAAFATPRVYRYIKNNPQPLANLKFATRPDSFEKSPAVEPQPKIEQISFTGLKNADRVRSLGHITCPCCGIEMMTQKDMNKVTKGLGCTSKQAVKTLNEFEDNMRPVDKQCFNLLKDWSKEKPDANFRDLLQEHREPELKKLQAKQNTILDTVDTLSKTLSEKEQETVKKVTDETRKYVSSNDKEIKFKRKAFLKDMNELESKISDEKVYKQMRTEAEKMPTSQNDVSAFVVKYSDRRHSEIGQRLVKLSVGTIEHIKPQSEGGRDVETNYLLECGGCNHDRSSIPLGDWVDMHPEMKTNTQKYMDEVIDRINTGKIKNFHFYPAAVAQTLSYQSDGKLEVDLSALKKGEDEIG